MDLISDLPMTRHELKMLGTIEIPDPQAVDLLHLQRCHKLHNTYRRSFLIEAIRHELKQRIFNGQDYKKRCRPSAFYDTNPYALGYAQAHAAKAYLYKLAIAQYHDLC